MHIKLMILFSVLLVYLFCWSWNTLSCHFSCWSKSILAFPLHNLDAASWGHNDVPLFVSLILITVRCWIALVKSVKKAFFTIWPPPWGLVFQNKSQLSNFKMDIGRSFFHPPFLTILNHWKGQKSCFLTRIALKKAFFPYDLPPGALIIVLSFHVVSTVYFFRLADRL